MSFKVESSDQKDLGIHSVSIKAKSPKGKVIANSSFNVHIESRCEKPNLVLEKSKKKGCDVFGGSYVIGSAEKSIKQEKIIPEPSDCNVIVKAEIPEEIKHTITFVNDGKSLEFRIQTDDTKLAGVYNITWKYYSAEDKYLNTYESFLVRYESDYTHFSETELEKDEG